MHNKILIHAPNLSTPGGKQSYFTALKDHFDSEIEFFFYGSQGQKESAFKTLIRLFNDYYRFYKLLHKNNFSLVHLNPSLNTKSFFRDSIFSLICSIANVKTTVFWHGWRWDFEKKVVSKIVPWFRLTYGKVNSMIVLGQEFEDRLKKYGYKNPVHRITTVADEIFFSQEMKEHSFNKEHNLNQKISILFLSRIEKSKGIYEAIDGFNALKNDYSNLVLKIAGTGSEIENIKTYIKINQIANVELLGWVSGETKARIFRESDIYLFPSYSEGLPCTILEAMASNLAILTTDVGGIKDIFEDKKMGYLIQLKSPFDITEKLKLLIDNPKLTSSIRNHNRKYAEQNFKPKQVALKLEQIYANTIQNYQQIPS